MEKNKWVPSDLVKRVVDEYFQGNGTKAAAYMGLSPSTVNKATFSGLCSQATLAFAEKALARLEEKKQTPDFIEPAKAVELPKKDNAVFVAVLVPPEKKTSLMKLLGLMDLEAVEI